MPLTVRQNRLLAANLFLGSMLLFQFPHYLLLLQIFSSSLPTKTASNIQYVILGQALLSVALVVAIGLGLRAGRIWATALFVLYLLWQAFLTLSSLLAPPKDPLAWGLILLPLGCLLLVAFFLFRGNFSRRPATPVAEGQ